MADDLDALFGAFDGDDDEFSVVECHGQQDRGERGERRARAGCQVVKFSFKKWREKILEDDCGESLLGKDT